MNRTDHLTRLPERAPMPALADGRFDQMAVLTRRVMHVPIVLVSLVDREQQVLPGAVGLAETVMAVRSMPLSHSFCQYVVAEGSPLIVPDAREHPLLAGNPTIEENQVIAYAGMPLTETDGTVVGSLCVIDDHPREWTDEELATLSDLAAACSAELRLRSAAEQAAVAVDRERIVGELREHVIGELLSLSMLLGSARSTATGRTGEQMEQAMATVDDVLRSIRSTVYHRPQPV